MYVQYLYENRSWGPPDDWGPSKSLECTGNSRPTYAYMYNTCIVWHVSDKKLHNKIYIIQNNFRGLDHPRT